MQGLPSDAIEKAAALAAEAALDAGRKLAEAQLGWLEADSQVGRDIKLRADREAETIILGHIRARSPYPILSEESGGGEAIRPGSPYWVIDPLDGTHNYSRGIPLCCISIALCRDDQTLHGCVHDFNRGEMFTATEGGPFLRNGHPAPSLSKEDILATGLPRKGDFSADRLARFGPHIARWRQVRLIGSAALSLAWVAAGRFDAYEESGILWWDVAAGVGLVRAAGGSVSVLGDRIGGTLDVSASRIAHDR